MNATKSVKDYVKILINKHVMVSCCRLKHCKSPCTEEVLCRSALIHKAALYLAVGHMCLLTCTHTTLVCEGLCTHGHLIARHMPWENGTDRMYATLDLMVALLGHYCFCVNNSPICVEKYLAE